MSCEIPTENNLAQSAIRLSTIFRLSNLVTPTPNAQDPCDAEIPMGRMVCASAVHATFFRGPHLY